MIIQNYISDIKSSSKRFNHVVFLFVCFLLFLFIFDLNYNNLNYDIKFPIYIWSIWDFKKSFEKFKSIMTSYFVIQSRVKIKVGSSFAINQRNVLTVKVQMTKINIPVSSLQI